MDQFVDTVKKIMSWQAALILGAFALLYGETLYNLVNYWANTDDASHGFLIIPISLYLIYEKRDELFAEEPSSCAWGLLLLILSMITFFLSKVAGVFTLTSVSMMGVFFGVALYLCGVSITRKIFFPLMFLVFMFPVPSQIYSTATIPLQLAVSKFAAHVSSVLGVILVREGNVIELPSRTLEVVAACSGLRSLMTLFALGALIGYLRHKRFLVKTVLFLLAIPVAIAINIVRVTAIATFLYHLEIDLLSEPLHTVLGLAVFLIALVLMAGFSAAASYVEDKWPGRA